MRDSKETQQPSKIIGNLQWVFHQTPTFRNCNIYIKKMIEMMLSEIILSRDPKILKLYHHSHCFNGHKIGEKNTILQEHHVLMFPPLARHGCRDLGQQVNGDRDLMKTVTSAEISAKKSRISPEIRCKHTELSHQMANLRYPATK